MNKKILNFLHSPKKKFPDHKKTATLLTAIAIFFAVTMIFPIFAYAQSSGAGSAPVIETPWLWYITRASAITAYLLLFFLVVSGICIKTSLLFKIISPSIAWINHRLVGFALTFSVLAHVIALYLDKDAGFSLGEILIPFYSDFRPLYVSFGILGFYILALVVLTSIYFIDKHPKEWRLFHYLPYLLFVLITSHGFNMGTDTTTIWMLSIYYICSFIVGTLTLYRLWFFYIQVR